MTVLLRHTVIAAATVLLAHAMPAAAQPVQLNMGGSTTTTPFFAYYSAVAETISRNDPGLNVTVVSTGGFATNVRQLISGQLQFGGVSPDLIEDAENANPPFRDFRVLWWAVPAIQYIVVRADSPIRTLADISGRCFHAGMRGSSSEKNMLRIIRTLGYTPQLYPADAADAINAIRTGRCLGQARTGGLNNVDANTAELALTVPLRPIGYTAEEVAKIRAAIPWMSFRDMPAGVLGAGPFTTHELMVGFAATTRLDPELGYRLMKAMHAGIPQQKEAFAPFRPVDLVAQTLGVKGMKLHAGTVRLFRELGHTVPDDMIPPEAR
jgi:TRAP transporter TAXI family solute receptor